MSLLARIKSIVCRFMLLMEFCHDCGRRVDQVWTADDALWARLVNGQGPRCIRCFDRRAVAAGLPVRWVPQVEHEMTPRGREGN